VRQYEHMDKLDKHKEMVQNFISTNGHEPTSLDFDKSPLLPTARTIQRLYGGLPQFRTLANLKTNDFTKGRIRAKRAKKSMSLSNDMETEIFKKLLSKHGSRKASSPAKLFLNSAKTVDFKVELDDKIYLFDVFYPTTQQSFSGCVNIKNKKYHSEEDSFYTEPVEIILVCLNEKMIVPTNSKLKVISIKQFNNLVGIDFMLE